MEIHYSDAHPIPDRIYDLIASNALSHSIVKDDSVPDLMLIEGSVKVVGVDAIHDHLIALIKEFKLGWYCHC